MAFYFAHGKIVKFVKWTALSLYIASTVLFTIRILGNGYMAVRARTALIELGSDYLISNSAMGSGIGISFFVIVGLGTIATLYYCINSEKLAE